MLLAVMPLPMLLVPMLPIPYLRSWREREQVMGLDLDLFLLENQQQIQWGLGFITTLFLLPIRL